MNLQAKAKPDVKTAGFSLWIHDREFPEALDAPSANWLIVSAHLDTGSGRSWVNQLPCLTSSEIAHFIELAQGFGWHDEETIISCETIEQNVKWSFIKDKRHPNEIIFKVRVNSNALYEMHVGWFRLTFIEAKGFLTQLLQVLQKFPVL